MLDTNALFEALYAKHLATPALLAAFPGGCHIEIAPSGTAGTYLVIEFASSPIDHAYGTASTANPLVILKAVGLSRTGTAAALKLWTDLLDNPATSITGAYSFMRMGGSVPSLIGPDEASNTNDLWQWAAAYQFATN